MVFHYPFEGDEGWHGFTLLSLDNDGKRVIDPLRRCNVLPRQLARRYPAHFFQPGEVPPDTEVLFFLGSDDAWGVLMLGAGESVSFSRWSNDGDTHAMPGTFTEVLERLLAHGFAHTWAYDKHSDTNAVLARLSREVPLRKTFELTVDARTSVSGSEYRRGLAARWDDATLDKLLRALGAAKKQLDAATREQKLALLDEYCARPDALSDKAALAGMKALGHKAPTRELFLERLACGAGGLARVTPTLRYLPGTLPFAGDEDTLIRVLDDVPELRVTEGFPGPRELLQNTNLARAQLYWRPFLESQWHEPSSEESPERTYTVLMTAERARGLEVGKSFSSTALPCVESRVL